MAPESLDADVVEHLASEFARVVRDHYARRPISPETLYETLNAIAIVTAYVVEGGGEPAATFFLAAFEAQRKDQCQP